MMMTLRVLATAFLVASSSAAEPPGFAIWKSSELRQRDAALSRMVGPDHLPAKRSQTMATTASECCIETPTACRSSMTTSSTS